MPGSIVRAVKLHAATAIAICLLACAAAATGNAQTQSLGVVLLHGKQGTPMQLQRLRDAITDAGFLTASPEMCWSRTRIYDHGYLDCFDDVDTAVAQVKAQGAIGVVILGMSLGGNGALGYGARRKDLKGIIALAPAPPVEFLRRIPRIAASIARAEAMVAAGHGNQRASFADSNTGNVEFEVETTADIYLSFFGPHSPAVMPENAERLRAPLLAISGDADPSQRSIPYVFARAPDNPLNQRLVVPADHIGTPQAAREHVLAWLRVLKTH